MRYFLLALLLQYAVHPLYAQLPGIENLAAVPVQLHKAQPAISIVFPGDSLLERVQFDGRGNSQEKVPAGQIFGAAVGTFFSSIIPNTGYRSTVFRNMTTIKSWPTKKKLDLDLILPGSLQRNYDTRTNDNGTKTLTSNSVELLDWEGGAEGEFKDGKELFCRFQFRYWNDTLNLPDYVRPVFAGDKGENLNRNRIPKENAQSYRSYILLGVWREQPFAFAFSRSLQQSFFFLNEQLMGTFVHDTQWLQNDYHWYLWKDMRPVLKAHPALQGIDRFYYYHLLAGTLPMAMHYMR